MGRAYPNRLRNKFAGLAFLGIPQIMATLCVNIDHVATVRQARRGAEPEPVAAVAQVEMGGSTGVTVHLREDQRHIQQRDVELIRHVVQGRLNLEMAATPDMVRKAIAIDPDLVTLVPEKREEITTEGGLDVVGQLAGVRQAVEKLRAAAIRVSMFIDPLDDQIEASLTCGAEEIELHTGQYALANCEAERSRELKRLYEAAARANGVGLVVNAGHGLNYQNVRPVAAIPDMRELNIGHSIVSRAIFDGLRAATSEMTRLIDEATRHPHPWRPAGY